MEARDLPVIGLRASLIREIDEIVSERRPRIPLRAGNLEEMLAWLRECDEEVHTAPRGASAAEVAALEGRLGRTLPPSYTSFLRRFHWIESRLLTTFAVTADGKLPTIEAKTAAVRRYVDDTLAHPALAAFASNPEIERRAAVVRSGILVAEIGGNALPAGPGGVLQKDNSFVWLDFKEFTAQEGDSVSAEDFEAWLFDALVTEYEYLDEDDSEEFDDDV